MADMSHGEGNPLGGGRREVESNQMAGENICNSCYWVEVKL